MLETPEATLNTALLQDHCDSIRGTGLLIADIKTSGTRFSSNGSFCRSVAFAKRVTMDFFAVVPLLAVSWHLEEQKGAATVKKSAVASFGSSKSHAPS